MNLGKWMNREGRRAPWLAREIAKVTGKKAPTRAAVGYWISGERTPGLEFALAINKITGNEVSLESFLEGRSAA